MARDFRSAEELLNESLESRPSRYLRSNRAIDKMKWRQAGSLTLALMSEASRSRTSWFLMEAQKNDDAQALAGSVYRRASSSAGTADSTFADVVFSVFLFMMIFC